MKDWSEICNNVNTSFKKVNMLLNKNKKIKQTYLPTVSGGDSWLHTFPQGRSTIWNTNSFIQEL